MPRYKLSGHRSALPLRTRGLPVTSHQIKAPMSQDILSLRAVSPITSDTTTPPCKHLSTVLFSLCGNPFRSCWWTPTSIWLSLKHSYVCYHLMQSIGVHFRLWSHWTRNQTLETWILSLELTKSNKWDDSPFWLSLLPSSVTVVTPANSGSTGNGSSYSVSVVTRVCPLVLE